MIFCWDNYQSKKNEQERKTKTISQRVVTYEISQVESVDKSLVEMDEMLLVQHLLDQGIERDVLHDRVEVMEQKLDGRMERILSDVLM